MGSYRAFEGELDASGMRIAIVAGRFNDHVTKPLLEGAVDTLARPRPRRRGGLVGPGGIRDPARRATSRAHPRRRRVPRRGDPGRHPALRLRRRGVPRPASNGSRSTPARPWSSVCSPSTPSIRPSSAPGAARATRAPKPPAPRSRWSSLLRRLPAADRETVHVAPRSPERVARAPDPPAVRGRRPLGVERLRRRLPRLDRRPADRRGAHPAAAGDPGLRRRRPLRPRHRRPRQHRGVRAPTS